MNVKLVMLLKDGTPLDMGGLDAMGLARLMNNPDGGLVAVPEDRLVLMV